MAIAYVVTFHKNRPIRLKVNERREHRETTITSCNDTITDLVFFQISIMRAFHGEKAVKL